MFSNKQTGYVGIDIGSSTVKLAQVRMNGDQLQLVDAAIVPRQGPWIFDSNQSIRPRSSVGEIQAALSIADHIQGNDSACSATMAVCDVRSMQIEMTYDDAVNRSQIQTRIQGIDRLGALPRQFDYCPIVADWQTNSANVLVLSMPTDWAAQIGEDQTLAGLNCRLLDGQPVALARAAKLANVVRPGEPVVMIDWGYQRATFCLSVDGLPVFVRILRGSGFKQVLDSVGEWLEVNESDAARLLRQTGLPGADEKPMPLHQAIEEATSLSLSIFANELERTWEFLRKNHAAHLPRKVLLTGGGSVIANICPWLASKSTLLFETWTLPISPIPGHPPVNYPVSLLGSAIGLSALAFQRSECLA